ncbi:MAG: thiolase family protein [Elusimicrobia bacterium]|nr:thiolase family protein [Elusimicrobiota bacterium]
MDHPVLIDAVRTPMGRHGGALSAIRPDDLAAHVISELIRRNSINPELIDDVIFGCANQAGEDNRNVARLAGLLAGLPQRVPGVTVNRLCASGLEAINQAARAIMAGEGDFYIAGGVESMSRAPWVLPKAETGFSYGNLMAYDTALGWRFPNLKLSAMFPLESMGETAENIFEAQRIPRREQDRFAFESHQKAWAASQSGKFHDEIIPVSIPSKKAAALIEQDETIRPDTTLDKLAALAPAFRKNGSVTAGNASSLNDGAAAVLVMSPAMARKLGLKPIARWLGSAAEGVNPRTMGLGPVPCTRKLLSRLNIGINSLDLIELNEAFAVQALACIKELGLDPAKVNVNGGAIALGHPLGCSGARLATTMLHEMKRRDMRHGLITLCVGVGQGVATIIEKISTEK